MDEDHQGVFCDGTFLVATREPETAHAIVRALRDEGHEALYVEAAWDVTGKMFWVTP